MIIYLDIPSFVLSRSRLLWYPVLVPQITGGAVPPDPVTEKASVWQFVAKLAAIPRAVVATDPAKL